MLALPLVNIANNGKDVILFSRYGRELRITKDATFLPYFFEPSAKGIFITIDGKKVNKVFCRKPSEVKQKRTEFSYEADILFTKRYIIDKISEFRPAELKYSFVDIEVITKELPSHLNPIHPVSCISCSNSYTDEIKTFFLKDYHIQIDTDLETKEKQLLNEFVEWTRKEQFDMILGWNFIAFDYVYLSARYKFLFGVELADMLSPLNQNRWLSKSKVDMQEILAPVGLSIIDYLDFFKKVYRTESSYALDSIAQKYLNEESIGKFDFSKLTEEIKAKNIKDVQRMIALDKKLKLIAYYDEIRRMGKCLWEDLTWYSKVLDVMLLSEAKQKGLILPSKRYSEDIIDEPGFEGAYRRCETGRFEGLWKVDLSSAYPASIINFCLDIANLTNITTEQKIDITDRETNEIKQTIYVKQNFNAVLPTLARKLVAKKDTLKRQLKALDPESEEAKDLQIKYDATKALVNSLFGVCGLKVFRLFDYRIASAITSIVRDLLHYVEDKVQTLGMKVIYLDTDSFFIDAKENPTELLNSLIKQWAKEKYNKDSIDIEFDCEGRFSTLLVIALCHYVGDLETKKGVKREIKGVEAKRKDSSVFMKKFQEELIDMILKNKSREAIETFIASQKEAIKQAPLVEIGFPCKVNNEKVYKSPPIFQRALEYTKELVPTFDKVSGDSFYYIYVDSFGSATRKSSRMWKNKDTGVKELQKSETEVDKDVLAFDAESYSHVKNVNWNEMLRRTINEKVEHIFEALKWNVEPSKKVLEDSPFLTGKKRGEAIKKNTVKKEILEEVKCLLPINVLPKVDISKEETFNISHSFKTKAEITDRTIMVAEAFGLGIDDEKSFTIYDNVELKVKTGDIIYITGDSGSGKSWILNNVFAKMPNAISINDLKIDDNEVVVEGVGKNLNDALMKLNIAGLGDAFLYLRKYSQLSDGQKYRYRIAKFIDHEEKAIWILDEFCATLDRTTAKIVATNLHKIARKLSKTVVVATTHTDLLEEIKPTVHIVKGYESDIVINYYNHSNWENTKLSFFKEMKVEVGEKADYERLKKFHYRQAALGALKKVYKCTYQHEVVGVIVVCYPHLALKGRNVALKNTLAKMTKENCEILNRDFDYLARVIILPKFRGIGLSQFMLKEYFKLTDAKYAETLAVMANYNPFFEKAGMTKIDVEEDKVRTQRVKDLEEYGFNTSLISSARYCRSIYNNLTVVQQMAVKEIVKAILSRYKGQISKLFSQDESVETLIEKDVCILMKELQRANTIYLIKQLKE
jgi:DNA polymerase elongation subunit (family B)/ABC-type lipoprotein export system ATPase subunit